MAVAMSYHHPEMNHSSDHRGRDHQQRTWDEDIVPALRKRLEGESMVISRRMSGASFVSGDESPSVSQAIQSTSTDWKTPSSNNTSISKLPRPSLSYENNSSSDLGHSSTPNTPRKRMRQRARTISTPQASDMEFTASTSSSNHDREGSAPVPRINGNARDLSLARSRIPRPNISNISPNPNIGTPSPLALESPSYFASSSNSQSQEILYDMPLPSHTPSSPLYNRTTQENNPPPRPSMESDKSEHEFEHWYRGDISRSGGVGEIRTGRRREMLDIANYGHAPSPAILTPNSRPNSILRRRASLDSLTTGGAGDRGSVYIEDDTIGKAVTEWVIDEMPLTDGEWSGPETASGTTHSYSHHPQPPNRSSQKRARPASPTSAGQTQPTNIPIRATLDTKQGQIHGRRPIQVSTTNRSFTAPVPSTGKPIKSSLSQKSNNNKRTRTQSSAAKPKPKSQAGQAAPKKKVSEPSLRIDSINVHDDDGNERPLSMNLINAIPTWREPILKDGARWDEVILPAVAKRMGLEGYQEVNGYDNRPRRQEDTRLEPAPGTFGYDPSKYRPPRSDNDPPVADDFGQRPPPSPSPQPHRPPPLDVLPPRDSTGEYNSTTPEPHSPAPFSRYMKDRESAQGPQGGRLPPQQRRRMEEIKQPSVVVSEKEMDEQAGCCGGSCVIM